MPVQHYDIIVWGAGPSGISMETALLLQVVKCLEDDKIVRLLRFHRGYQVLNVLSIQIGTQIDL